MNAVEIDLLSDKNFDVETTNVATNCYLPTSVA